MDYFSKNKLLVTGIVILILLNVVSIGTFWFGFIRPPMNGPRLFGNRGMQLPPPEQFIEKELNFKLCPG